MSQDDVLTRKDLKQPDKFQEVAKGAIDWISARKRQARLLGLAAGALVVAGLIAGLVARSRAQKAGALAYEVARVAGAQVSPVPLPGVPGPFFATDVERQQAVVREADRVLAEYPSTPGGRLALLLKGDAQLKLGERDAAIATFQRYLDEVAGDEPLRFAALAGIAQAQEGAGRLDEAAAALERAAREVAPFADRADLDRARVLARAGKVADARKILEGFAERHKGSALAVDAADTLARLGPS